MINQPPSPIDSQVQTIKHLIDFAIGKPDLRALIRICLDGIVATTDGLWNRYSLEAAEYERIKVEALRFYADGGKDGGERARAVFAVMERDRAYYITPMPPFLKPQGADNANES